MLHKWTLLSYFIIKMVLMALKVTKPVIVVEKNDMNGHYC